MRAAHQQSAPDGRTDVEHKHMNDVSRRFVVVPLELLVREMFKRIRYCTKGVFCKEYRKPLY
jgi:hypothetical protein